MSAVVDLMPSFAPMRADDLNAVMAIERTLYPFPWTRVNFADSLAAGYSAWVCRAGGQLVGYAVMMLVLDEAHLLNFSVARQWQGRGYGLALLEHLLHCARGNGSLRMFLEVRPSNARAISLYQRRGFERIGVRRGYYPAAKGREDAIVMALDL